MIWVKLSNESKAHAIFKLESKTACGIDFGGDGVKVAALNVERCRNCDAEWRRRGRENKPPRKHATGVNTRTLYKPRFDFEKHWAVEPPPETPRNILDE